MIARIDPNEKEWGITDLSLYAGVSMWAAAVRAARSTDAQKVAQVMRDMSFDTIFGKIRFEKNGDLTPDSVRWQAYVWSKGQLQPWTD